jgi:hypothetical protein
MFLQQGPKLFFECHLAMMNLLTRNGCDNRLAHLAPFQGVRLIGSFPGLKPMSAKIKCPRRAREAHNGRCHGACQAAE